MPPPAGQFLVGQRPRRPYVNRASTFFAQVDKGFASPYVVVASGVFFSFVAWRVTDHFVRPRQEQLRLRQPVQRVPFEASHNVFWGFASTSPAAAADDTGRGTVADIHSDAAASSGVQGVASNLYVPQSANEGQEEAMRRPKLLFSESSELHERPSAANPTGEVDVVCLELSEFDPRLRDDLYYRSVHYVPAAGEPVSAAAASTAGSGTGAGGKHMTSPGAVAAAAAAAGGGGGASSSAPPSAEDVAKVVSTTDYLQFMPGQGEEVVHGMVKCKGITTQNNCVPYAGHLEEEYARKMMLSLGPAHILRDVGKTTVPWRFSYLKETPVETLVLGMHSGEMPRWLSTVYPNYKVHVVERDGTLVRLCKRFLGFQETSNLSVHVGDPVEFVRQHATAVASTRQGASSPATSADGAVKPFELVLIDGMDGAGRLSTQFGRLEFIGNVRGVMGDNGCVAMTLPNRDAAFVFNMVQNWRMAFSGRPVVLVHCVTAPCTVLMTFQDSAARGKANIGSIGSVEEFQDILREHVRHYGSSRMQFDITREVSAANFRVLNPEQTYTVDAYLPAGHPASLAARKQELEEAMRRQKGDQGWGAWLRRAAGACLSTTQRTDLGAK